MRTKTAIVNIEIRLLKRFEHFGDFNFDFNFDFNLPKRWDASLFGEDQSRIIVSTSLENSGTLRRYCDSIKLPYTTLGKVTDGNFNIGTLINLSISDLVSMGKTI